MLRAFASGWLDLLAPLDCAECRATQVRRASGHSPPALCGSCQARVPRLVCTCPTRSIGPPAPACPACSGWGADLPHCRAPVVYGAGSESWIRRFKYPRSGPAGLDPAARFVVEDWIRAAVRLRPGPPPVAVVPVPLHPRRLRERGFNPAALLATAVARELGSAVAPPTLLVRVRDTPSQTQLDRKARQANVAEAFGCRPRRTVAQGSLLLVDDVATTGATLVAAARALRQAGFQHLDAVCAARTTGGGPIRTTRSAS